MPPYTLLAIFDAVFDPVFLCLLAALIALIGWFNLATVERARKRAAEGTEARHHAVLHNAAWWFSKDPLMVQVILSLAKGEDVAHVRATWERARSEQQVKDAESFAVSMKLAAAGVAQHPAAVGGLTFGALRAANIARVGMFQDANGKLSHPEGVHGWTPEMWMLAALSEGGEAGNLYKKIKRGDFTLESARADLAAEFADLLIYWDLAALSLGIDLGAATAEKFNRVSRKQGHWVLLPEPKADAWLAGDCPVCNAQARRDVPNLRGHVVCTNGHVWRPVNVLVPPALPLVNAVEG